MTAKLDEIKRTNDLRERATAALERIARNTTPEPRSYEQYLRDSGYDERRIRRTLKLARAER